MAKRLNDTAGLVAVPLDGASEHTVSVRKMGDGYLIRTSRFNSDTGAYTCDEEYTKAAPRLSVEGGRDSSVGAETLSDTKRYLGNDV